jgi:transcriptional regulator with AAA-type ATPase domain
MDPKVIPMPSLPSSNASSLSAKALVFEDPRSQALREQILAFAPDQVGLGING